MRTIKCKAIVKLLVVLSLPAVSGCGVAVMEATNGAYNHLRGDLVGIVPYRIEQVLPAAVTVVGKIDGYDLASQQSDFLNAQVLAYDEKSRKVEIDLSRTADNQTKIQIRIGLIGDKMQSSMIFNYIINRLSEQQVLNSFQWKEKGQLAWKRHV